jgi:hypothetical protein
MLDPIPLTIETQVCSAAVTAHLYDFGVISLAVSLPATNIGWTEFCDLLNATDRTIGGSSGSGLWASLLTELKQSLHAALDRPSAVALEEDYIIGLVRAFDRPYTASEIHEQADLVRLLSGDTLPLSQGSRQDLLRQKYSYYADDLVVLTWDRAFIYEPRGDSDVIDVLEVANAQLLEMRYYDELLDGELPRMYDLVATTQRAGGLTSSRRLARLARRLYALVAEVTELTEKVDNALQVTEDVYLARIYTAALDLFRVPLVGAAVDRKLSIIRDTYAALYDEASGARAELLEVAIIALIVVEIALALMHG